MDSEPPQNKPNISHTLRQTEENTSLEATLKAGQTAEKKLTLKQLKQGKHAERATAQGTNYPARNVTPHISMPRRHSTESYSPQVEKADSPMRTESLEQKELNGDKDQEEEEGDDPEH
ncbi:hypothetical protein C0993_004218 [Termitomyces sp. T159_Od127]|nr:hypothetical protein C0993_004218 [Termitomyces sp. T159_Od127]